MRLRRADLSAPGYHRRRSGRGFTYLDPSGRPLRDPEQLARIRALVIPPAWTDVWISPDPRGHIQAVGTDAAGRRQYRYHDEWRVKRDAAKFSHVLDVAERLPRLRRTVARHLRERGLSRERVLAAAVRLLDIGAFRIGGEEYARDDGPTEATYGLTTLLREHASVRGNRMSFCYPAKGGTERDVTVSDAGAAAVVRALLRRSDPGERLFVWRDGRQWREVRGSDVNEYLREVTGCAVSAKDFRTWHATVFAAVSLSAASPPPRSASGQRRVVAAVMRGVADFLGNTPTVARASYVDPQILDLYREGALAGLPTPNGSGPVSRSAQESVLHLLRD